MKRENKDKDKIQFNLWAKISYKKKIEDLIKNDPYIYNKSHLITIALDQFFLNYKPNYKGVNI